MVLTSIVELMVLTSIVEFAVVLSTFVVKLMALINDEVELIILTGVVMVLTPIVELNVVLSTIVVKLLLPITDDNIFCSDSFIFEQNMNKDVY